MKKESITICVNNQLEAKRIREDFEQNEYINKYKLNIIICGKEDPVGSLSSFLLEKIK